MKALVLLFLFQQAFSELKFVCELFRHGARHKVFRTTDELKGELSAVGQRQHFLLGSQLRKEYIEERQFLSPQFKATEMNVMSTNYNRTI